MATTEHQLYDALVVINYLSQQKTDLPAETQNKTSAAVRIISSQADHDKSDDDDLVVLLAEDIAGHLS
jgi:hypothetical protein